MNPNKIVCQCCEVTNGMIKDAIDHGANTLEDVQDQPVPELYVASV